MKRFVYDVAILLVFCVSIHLSYVRVVIAGTLPVCDFNMTETMLEKVRVKIWGSPKHDTFSEDFRGITKRHLTIKVFKSYDESVEDIKSNEQYFRSLEKQLVSLDNEYDELFNKISRGECKYGHSTSSHKYINETSESIKFVLKSFPGFYSELNNSKIKAQNRENAEVLKVEQVKSEQESIRDRKKYYRNYEGATENLNSLVLSIEDFDGRGLYVSILNNSNTNIKTLRTKRCIEYDNEQGGVSCTWVTNASLSDKYGNSYQIGVVGAASTIEDFDKGFHYDSSPTIKVYPNERKILKFVVQKVVDNSYLSLNLYSSFLSHGSKGSLLEFPSSFEKKYNSRLKLEDPSVAQKKEDLALASLATMTQQTDNSKLAKKESVDFTTKSSPDKTSSKLFWKYKDWEVSTQNDNVYYVTHGELIQGHEFGFLKTTGSCDKDTLWLSWSTREKGIDPFEGEEVIIQFTIDDIKLQLKSTLSDSYDFGQVLTLIRFSYVDADDRLISLLKKGKRIYVTIIPPEKIANKFDILTDSFSLNGFTATMLKSKEFCEKESLIPNLDKHTCQEKIDESYLLGRLNGGAQAQSKFLNLLETCLPQNKTMQKDVNSIVEKFIIDIDRGHNLPFPLQPASVRFLYKILHINAQAGNGPSQHNFAVIHNANQATRLIKYVPQNYDVFVYWTLKAASQGISGSMFNLAARLANGVPLYGFQADRVLAYKLFIILKKMGYNKDSTRKIMSEIEQKLGYKQIEIIKSQFNEFELSSLEPNYEEPLVGSDKW